MKKRIVSVLLISAMLLTSAGCKKKDSTGKVSSQTETSATESETESVTESTPSSSETSSEPSEYAFSEKDMPGIDFCYSARNLAFAAASVLLNKSVAEVREYFAENNYDFTWGDAAEGVAIFPSLSQDLQDKLHEPVAKDALVFIVNKDNPVDSLSMENIRKIYKGEIKNWKDVGGQDQAIVPYAESSHDTSTIALTSLVLGGEITAETPIRNVPGDDYAVWSDSVTFANASDAIGYIEYSSLLGSHWENEVKILKIDDVAPSPETIGDDSYPVTFSLDVATFKHADPNGPAFKLYNWLLSEDGRKLVEMAGYIAPNTTPPGKLDVPVAANWSAFQKPEKKAEVISRLSEEHITDYTPSAEYGAVIPFMGVENETYWVSGQTLYGLVDQNGRIICDPVFDWAYYLDDGSLVVGQDVVNTKREDLDYKIGIISKDGTSYTGLTYDGKYMDGKDLYLYTIESNGIKIYKYDFATAKAGSGKLLKMDTSTLYCFDRVVEERYVICEDDFDDKIYVFDGTTGKDIRQGVRDIHVGRRQGNFLFAMIDDVNTSVNRISSVDGKALSDNLYSEIFDLENDTFLLRRTEKDRELPIFDIVDQDGKILTTFEDQENGICEVTIAGEYIVLQKETSMNLYDYNGKFVKKIDVENAGTYYSLSTEMGAALEDIRFEKNPSVLCASDSMNTKILNLETGVIEELHGEFDCYNLGDRILIQSSYGNPLKWMLWDASDFSTIAEGKDSTEIIRDYSDYKLYLCHGTRPDAYYTEVQIMDVETGKDICQFDAGEGTGSISMEMIHAGRIVFKDMQPGNSRGLCDQVTVTDLSGKELMRYNTVALPYR